MIVLYPTRPQFLKFSLLQKTLNLLFVWRLHQWLSVAKVEVGIKKLTKSCPALYSHSANSSAVQISHKLHKEVTMSWDVSSKIYQEKENTERRWRFFSTLGGSGHMVLSTCADTLSYICTESRPSAKAFTRHWHQHALQMGEQNDPLFWKTNISAVILVMCKILQILNLRGVCNKKFILHIGLQVDKSSLDAEQTGKY